MAHQCRAVKFVTVFCIFLVGLFISAGKAVRAISYRITCKVKRQENICFVCCQLCIKKKVSKPDARVNKRKCRIDRLLPMFVTGVPVRGW